MNGVEVKWEALERLRVNIVESEGRDDGRKLRGGKRLIS